MNNEKKLKEIKVLKKKNLLLFIKMIAIRLLIISGFYLFMTHYIQNANKYYYIGGKIMILFLILASIKAFLENLFLKPKKAKRIKKMDDHPKLWKAVNKIAFLSSCALPRVYINYENEKTACVYSAGTPKSTFVFFSQELVNSLNTDELEAVAAHEIGHVITKDSFSCLVLVLIDIYMLCLSFLIMILSFLDALDIILVKFTSEPIFNFSFNLTSMFIAGMIGVFYVIYAKNLMNNYKNAHQVSADILSAIITGKAYSLISAFKKISDYDVFAYEYRIEELKKYISNNHDK